MTAHAYSPWGAQPFNDNDNLPRVVAFTGVAGSGKSTASAHLQSKGYTLVKFAAPLKAMCRAVGMGDEEIEGDLKEVPARWLGDKTPRQFMQILGTEFARKNFGDDFWVNLWHREASAILDTGGRVVVDDCRFPNEAATVRRMGGDIYRLVGRGGIAGGHESERMDFIPDCLIENEGTQDDLHERIYDALHRYS